MTKADVDHIEQHLSVKLPQVYVELMTLPGPQRSDFWHGALFNRAETLIKNTVWLHELMASYNLPLKPTLVVISEIDGGDSVLLDVERETDQLFKHDHETNQILPFPTTLNAMANA